MPDSVEQVISEMRTAIGCDGTTSDTPLLSLELIGDWADRLEALRMESEWLPIETAPRDGTEIWAFNPTFEEQCVIRWCAGTEWSGWLYNDAILNDCLSIELSPTHWQPLPPPPAGEKE